MSHPHPEKAWGVEGILYWGVTADMPDYVYIINEVDYPIKMKLQDLHPYDSAIVGLNNLYRVDYKGDFFINVPFIIARSKKISTGSTFVLIYSRNNKKKFVHPVRLMDAYYTEGIINLVLQDIMSQETFAIDQKVECTGDHFKWVLIDFDYLVETLNSEIIKSYCGSCKNAKENSVANSNHRNLNNDLLEFDF
jgi:hypothetical protein